jgi:hypothetical protein
MCCYGSAHTLCSATDTDYAVPLITATLYHCVVCAMQTEQEAKQWVKLKLEVAAMTAAGGAANSSSDPNASYVEPEESTTGSGQQRQ